MRPGLRPGPHWGKLQSSPDPLAGFQGAASRHGREGEKGEKGRGGKGKGIVFPHFFFIVI